MQQKEPVSVLVAPLDWGLGHATRCIPIINELICQGALVTIAASGSQRALLEREFPLLGFIEIPGYEISFKKGVLLKWALVFKIPAIRRQIRKENKWLAETLQNHKIDAVISDNRYGLYHKDLFCIFITHQLFIQSRSPGAVGRWVDRILLKWNYSFIKRFSSCWIPDQEGEISLAGKLTHPPVQPPVPLKYIGILSRCKPMEKQVVKNPLLILLSGPEPQRTGFENILFRQLARYPVNAVLLRGLPGSHQSTPFIREGVTIYNHLPSAELNELLNESEFIIARSGYSTVMDLVKVKKNAILVPTPGQTEQEYLGHYLNEKKWMYSVPQKNFNLEKALTAFRKSKLILPESNDTVLKKVIEDFLKNISKRG